MSVDSIDNLKFDFEDLRAQITEELTEIFLRFEKVMDLALEFSPGPH